MHTPPPPPFTQKQQQINENQQTNIALSTKIPRENKQENTFLEFWKALVLNCLGLAIYCNNYSNHKLACAIWMGQCEAFNGSVRGIQWVSVRHSMGQ